VAVGGSWLDLIAETSGSGDISLPPHGVALVSKAAVQAPLRS